jgi:hypothetical protein
LKKYPACVPASAVLLFITNCSLHKILDNYQENGFSFDFARNTPNVMVPRPEFVKVKVEAYQNT